MVNVYISGGAGRQSVVDDGKRIPKAMLAAFASKMNPNLHFQTSPNHQTDVVLLPNGVSRPSQTTLSKLRPSKNVKFLQWTVFKAMYLSGFFYLVRAGGGSSRRMLQQSLEEEKVASRGTKRTWRLKRAKELLARNSQRPSKTRGWSLDFPIKGKERQALYRACGSRCFLGPHNLSFPVCKRCTGGTCQCRIDQRGVQAAYQRARQWGYPDIARRAKSLQSK